jgi:hypothetical protein
MLISVPSSIALFPFFSKRAPYFYLSFSSPRTNLQIGSTPRLGKYIILFLLFGNTLLCRDTLVYLGQILQLLLHAALTILPFSFYSQLLTHIIYQHHEF